MRRENKGKIKSLFLEALAVLAVSLAMAHLIRGVLAEKSGASPESGTDSRLTTITKKLEELGYGSTAAGSWGDWGAALNRVYSAAQGPFNDALAKGLKNGGGTKVSGCGEDKSSPSCFPQVLGGVDDYNNNWPVLAADTYQQTWTACNSDNNYCGLGEEGGNIAEKLDPNTGLVWSSSLGNNNWFWANNCVYPNGLDGDDGQCNTNGEVACQCVKRASSKTGCEGRAENGGGWRLPYQKELMQAYIDGSWGSLSGANADYWSGTTTSNYTRFAWSTSLSYGYTGYYIKTNSYSVRCVRQAF